MTEAAVPFEQLLAHREWGRELARRLVLDDARADDLAQETWLAALRTQVRGETPRAWLATVLRRGAGRMRRTDARRVRRETVAVERRGVAESPADTLARAEAHEDVVRAVMALEDPYKTAVLLRFFDDLPPREIARRMGAPVESVRSYVRTGLERMRTQLEGRHGGAWRAALAPLVLSKKSAGAAIGVHAAMGAIVMGTKIVAAAVVVAAVGAYVGWSLGTARADEALAAASRRADVATADARRAADEAADLRGRLEQSAAAARALEQHVRELTAERDARPSTAESATAAATTAPAPAVSKSPRFAFAQYEILDAIDWSAVAKVLADAIPAADEFGAAVAKGDKAAGMKAMTRLQATQMPLMTLMDPLEGQLPGTGPMGAFTGPAFLVNAVAATLAATGNPLTADQSQALERIGKDFVAEEERRLASYTETTFQLRREIDEGDLRRRLVDAIRAALAPQQRAALWPDGVRDRGGLDILSDGCLLGAICRPILWTDLDDLADRTTTAVLKQMDLGDERRAAVRAIVAAWAKSLPASALEATDDPARPSDLSTPLMRDGMRWTLQLYERVVVDLALDGDAAKTARGAQAGYMFLRMTK